MQYIYIIYDYNNKCNNKLNVSSYKDNSSLLVFCAHVKSIYLFDFFMKLFFTNSKGIKK